MGARCRGTRRSAAYAAERGADVSPAGTSQASCTAPRAGTAVGRSGGGIRLARVRLAASLSAYRAGQGDARDCGDVGTLALPNVLRAAIIASRGPRVPLRFCDPCVEFSSLVTAIGAGERRDRDGVARGDESQLPSAGHRPRALVPCAHVRLRGRGCHRGSEHGRAWSAQSVVKPARELVDHSAVTGRSGERGPTRSPATRERSA